MVTIEALLRGIPVVCGAWSAASEVIRDGEAIRRDTPGGAVCGLRFDDTGAGPGTHFYFLRIKLVGDPSFNSPIEDGELGPFSVDSRYPHNLARASGVWAWTSPIWVSVT